MAPSPETFPIYSLESLSWTNVAEPRQRTNVAIIPIGQVSTRAFSPDGHRGHPELVSAEKGEQLLERCAEVLARHVLTYVFDQHEVEPTRRES